MSKPIRLASLLLITTALVAPATAMAQSDPAAETPAPPATDPAADTPADPAADEAPVDDETDVSIPGGEIVVTGRRNANIERTAPQVVSVLGAADIARTGEGN
ncbi:MAG: TonB-dependent receptor, partial [Sphingopyxis sp.]|nr:TonB-dependent receptor [Sphingopyxis sp.]